MSPATVRASRLPAIRYRPARRTDVDALADLGTRAYRVASVEQRRHHYLEHPRFTLRDVRVAELDGGLVAVMVLYPLHAFVRSQRVPLIGVGSVAVSPEHRRRGIGEAMLRAALREMRAHGDGLSALYAFHAGFYRKLGWGSFEHVHQLAVAPANLPASDEARSVRRLKLPDRAAVMALYERVAQQGHFALERNLAWWTQRLWEYPGDWVVYENRRHGRIEGYLYYDHDATKGAFRVALTVAELVAATPAAHRGLVGYLASLADQYEEIQIATPGDAGWLALLRDAQNLRPGSEIGAYHDSGNVAQGALLRIVDVKAALERLPIAPQSRGEVVLEVRDPVLPANVRPFRVGVRDGRLVVTPARATRGPRLSAGIDALSSIAGGALSPLRAAELGLVDTSGGGAETIEPWFRARPAFLHQFNAF
jgi:predicted acetyltransferase